MKQDIVEKIESDFDEPRVILQMLEAMELVDGKPVSDRVYRSIVYLAAGSKEKLHHFIDLAYTDIRDLIWQAEYEEPERHKYDFYKPFDELGL